MTRIASVLIQAAAAALLPVDATSLAPLPAHAPGTPGGTRSVEVTVATSGAVTSGVAAHCDTSTHADAQAPAAAASTVLTTDGLAFRFGISPAPVPATGEWTVGIYVVRDGTAGLLAVLSAGAPVIELPRPLGVAFAAGDSVRIELRSGAGLALQLVVTVEYELREAAASRIAVVPLYPASTGNDHGQHSWEWTMPRDGRLLAIAGLRITTIGELVVEDVLTGLVVWRETLQPADAQAFSGAPGVVRSGVLLRAGREYRLRLRGADGPAMMALIAPAVAPRGID